MIQDTTPNATDRAAAAADVVEKLAKAFQPAPPPQTISPNLAQPGFYGAGVQQAAQTAGGVNPFYTPPPTPPPAPPAVGQALDIAGAYDYYNKQGKRYLP